MNNWIRRSFSLLLALVMIVGFVPVNLLVSASEENLSSAAGVVWLVKAESGPYAPASTELINNVIMGEKLDDLIRDAVKKTKNDDTILVMYDGMNVGSLASMTSNFQKLNAMRAEIVDAISKHKLVKFSVGGEVLEIAFRNYGNAQIMFAEDGKLYVEAGEVKPANLAALRKLVADTLNDTSKVYVQLAGKTSLEHAGCDFKINVKMQEWPGIGESPVKIGEVTVSLYADDVPTAEPKTVKAEVYIRDSRKECAVTYKAKGATQNFVVYEGTKTPAQTLINLEYYNVTWDKEIAATVEDNVTYTATSVTVKDPAFDKDGNGKDDREQSYMVTYYKDGALSDTVLPPFEMPYGTGLEHPADPAAGANGTFLGWRLVDENGNKTNEPAPVVLTGDIVCYPVWSETPKIKVIFNDRGEETVLFFDIAADGTIDDVATAFLTHPVAGVYSSGFYQKNGSQDLNKDGVAEEAVFTINTVYSGGDVYIDYYTDENGNGKQDILDPHYDVYVGKWNSATGEVVMVKAETWLLREELPAVIEKDAISAYAPDGVFNYNPGLFGYAISQWEVDNVNGTIKPVLGVDTNGNGQIDAEESTRLDIQLPAGFPYTVQWSTNDEGQYVALITVDFGGENFHATIEVSELAEGGRFIYNEGKTEIKVSPIMMGGDIGFYVDDVTIQVDAAGAEAKSIVAGYDENYYAYNKVSEVATAAADDTNMILTISYKEAATLSEKHPTTPPQLDPSQEKLGEEELYNLLVDGPTYVNEHIQVWYLSRVLAEKDRKVTVKLDGLKAYIESRFGAVLDVLPVDFEFPESMSVTLPAEQWTRLEDSPERDMLSAQAVADEYINRKIKEIEESGFDTAKLLPLASELVADLSTEIQAKAMIHKFGQVYPENGNPNDVCQETLRFEYTPGKYAKSLQTKIFTYDPDRIPVELKVVSDKLTYDYACVSDTDLLKNVQLINKNNDTVISGAALVLDRIDYYDDVDADTYTVTVSFQGDTTYKAAATPATFTLVINKVVPQISIDSMVITADDNYDYKADVKPGNAPVVQIIAGIESGEFELDENMKLVDKNVSAKVYVKIPDMYAKFLDGLTIEGYPSVNLGQFYNSDELREILDAYIEGRNLPGKDAINTVHGIMDVIPEVLNSLEPYELGLEKVEYLVRIDAASAEVRPTAPGIYVNFAASMGYIGQMLDQMGNPAAGLFENDNYIIGDMPSMDLSNPDDFNKIKNMCADAGIVIYTPMIPIPNSGGIQLYDEKQGIDKVENVYEYEYDGTPIKHPLKVAYKGAELAGAEPYYYGLTTGFNPTTEVPSMSGIYIAAYTYTEKDPANTMEIRRIGSDSAVIIIKQREADMTITGGSFEYDGTSKFPKISVTDKNGNEIPGAGKTVISGTVNVNTQGTNVTSNDLYGAVNIDFPAGLTIPYLNIDGVPARIEDAWNYYRVKILNKTENDKITPSNFIDFLEFCADKTEAAANKAVATFEKVGANRYVQSALRRVSNNVNSVDLSQDNLFNKVYRLQDMLHNGRLNYFDALIEQLRPLEKLDDNVWITMQDLETLDYSKTGIYLYMGVVTDPELTLGAAKGVVIIHSDDEYIMHDTHVPYDGEGHSVIIKDETDRDEITFILDRIDDGIVAISKDTKVLNIQLDRELAEKLIAELNTVMDAVTDEYEILDVIGRDLSVDTDFYVGSVYKKANGVADKLTEKILREVYKLTSSKLAAKYPSAAGTINEALDAALNLVEKKLTAMYPVLLEKLEAIDTLDSDAKIVISSYLPIDVAEYEITKFSFNTNEINILLDADVIKAVNAALDKINQEKFTSLKMISNGSNGYVITGYDKAEVALEVITASIFDELEAKLQAAIDKIPDISSIMDVDAKAEAEKLLNKLLDQQSRLVRWEQELLARMAVHDGLNDYTRIVINGKLPVEIGTYDFYGFDYDIARSRATLIIEPIYVQVSVVEGQWKYYGEVYNDLKTTVKYYSYETNPDTLAVEEVEITDAKLIAGAQLTYDVVCKEAKDPTAVAGEYPITIENEKIAASERYVLVDSIDGVFTVKHNDFVVEYKDTYTYNGNVWTVLNDDFKILVDGVEVDKELFVIEDVLSHTEAGAYTFKVTAKPESGYTGSVTLPWEILPAEVTSVKVITTHTYDGTVQTAQLVVKAGDLIVDTYDVLTGDTGMYAGDYTVWVQGTGNYTGLESCDWEIKPAEITDINLTAGNTFYYMDAEQTVAYTVNAGKLHNLSFGTDFVLDAVINAVSGTNVGEYTFKVIGTGNYTGETSAFWYIIPAEVKITAENKTMKMNAAVVPALTYTVEYVNGDVAPEKLIVALNTDPDINAAGQYIPGDYDIVVTADNTNANWTVNVVNGVLTVEAIEYLCWNTVTGVYYDDVTDALGEALSGHTIQMLKDATADYNAKNEDVIVVGAGITFDLNGHYVEAKNLLSFGVVMDSIDDTPACNVASVYADGDILSGGILISNDTTEAWTQLQTENGGYIPVYDTVTGSYKFFKGSIRNYGAFYGTSSQVQFWFQLLFDETEAYGVLANTDQSGLSIVLNMEWESIKNFDITYKIFDTTVKKYASLAYNDLLTNNKNGQGMYLKVIGLEKLDSSYISAHPVVTSVTSVSDVADGGAIVYNIP